MAGNALGEINSKGRPNLSAYNGQRKSVLKLLNL